MEFRISPFNLKAALKGKHLYISIKRVFPMHSIAFVEIAINFPQFTAILRATRLWCSANLLAIFPLSVNNANA